MIRFGRNMGRKLSTSETVLLPQCEGDTYHSMDLVFVFVPHMMQQSNHPVCLSLTNLHKLNFHPVQFLFGTNQRTQHFLTSTDEPAGVKSRRRKNK